jgi:hypothetical protein
VDWVPGTASLPTAHDCAEADVADARGVRMFDVKVD